MGEPVLAEFDLRRAWAMCRRRQWVAIMGVLLPIAAVLGLVPFLPNTYRASAVVLVERQQVPEAFVRSTVTSGLETRLHTISQEILSRARLEALIDRFTLYPGLRDRVPREALLERMRRDVQVELKGVDATVRGGNLVAFTISYRASEPHTAAAVANTLAASYLDENTKDRERQATGTAEFLRRQLEAVKQQLEVQEQRVSAFKAQYLGETPQHMQENLVMLDRLNTQLRLNSERQARAMDRREALSRQVAEAESFGTLFTEPAWLGAPGAAGGGPDPAAARLSKLKQDLTDLRTQFSDKYPDVVRLRAEIAALEKQVAEASAERKDQPEAAVPPEAKKKAAEPNPYVLQLKEAIGEVEAELKALRGEERRLHTDSALYQRRVENTPRREQEFQALSRDYGTKSDHYRTLLPRYEGAQLAGPLEQRREGVQFRFPEPAVPPKAPFAPNRLRLLLMGAIVALGFGAGAVVVTEQLDTSLHSVDDLRTVSPASVLVSIPRILTDGDNRRARRRTQLALVGLLMGVAVIAATAYLAATGRVPLVSALVYAWVLGP